MSIECCDLCGRDTKSKGRVCGKCKKGLDNGSRSQNEAGRWWDSLTPGDRDRIRQAISLGSDVGQTREDDIDRDVNAAVENELW